MFARLSVYENVDLDLADRVKEWFESVDADPFAELPGYRGSMTLVDRDNARLVGIGFYASAGQAQEADELLATMPDAVADHVPEAIRPALEMRPETVGLYEIVHRAGYHPCVPAVVAADRTASRCRSVQQSSQSHGACGGG